MLGATAESLEIGDLPIVTANMRASTLYYRMRNAMQRVKIRPLTIFPAWLCGGHAWKWSPKPGSGWILMYRLCKVNAAPIIAEISLAVVSALLFYAPAFFLQRLVKFMEVNKSGEVKDMRWGWVYCAGLFLSTAIAFLGEYASQVFAVPTLTYYL